MEHLDAKTYFERHAAEYDRWHRKNRYYYDCLVRWFRFVVPEGKRVYELGAGDGGLCGSLKPAEYGGIDLSPQLVEKARARYPEGHWQTGDATHGLGTTKTYDFIIGADFLAYVDDIQGALEQIPSACDDRTRVVFTKLNPLWNIPMRIAASLGLAQSRMYANWLSLGQTRRLVELAGFEIVRSGKFCLVPANIPIVSNFINRFIARFPVIWRFCAVEYVIARVSSSRTTGKSSPSVSVVIPARNEAGNVEPILKRMPAFSGKLEVVFVEGHSNDSTWENIQYQAHQNWPFTVQTAQQDGKGKGDAVRKGFAIATGDILMILDADMTVAPELLPRFYRILSDRSADYVQGTRLVYPMEKEAMRPLNWIGNKGFSALLSLLLGQRFSDTLCGTKCLWRTDYQSLAANRSYFGDFDPFGDFDLMFGAAKMNLKMQEIPIKYHERTYGSTNINRFRDGWLLIRMSWMAARKLYFV